MALLEVTDLKTWFPVRGSLFSKKSFVRAVDGVSFEIEKGQTLGLVGESGCGKSTLGRTIVRLEKAHSGSMKLCGSDIADASGAKLNQIRKKCQMIFQDPYSSLNPRMNIFNMLDEVLSLHTSMNKSERLDRIVELLEMAGLNSEQLYRYPHQFSGGQRQRIGIARALAVEPEIIIADEPVSALDVSVQAQIINLLKDIQEKTSIAYLFIAHDLAVVEHISDNIMVMYLGKIVEKGPAELICSSPSHPYTKALLSAVPTIDPQSKRKRIILPGDVPSPVNPPSGCPFHTRCPMAREKCKEEPPLRALGKDSSQYSACFFASEVKEEM